MGWFSWSFDLKVARLIDDLRQEAQGATLAAERRRAGNSKGAGAPAPQPLADVPPCVRRYLKRAALPAPRHILVTSRQEGEFRYDPQGAWQPMQCSQTSSPIVPGLVWSTRCRFKPLVGMHGVDWRVGGRGGVDWRLWGWLPALSEDGPGRLDSAMLARWLAETPGFPQAMLPSPWLRWEAVPGAANEARAVVTHGGATASGIFTFDDKGLVSSCRSEDYVRPGSPPEEGRKLWVVRYQGHTHVAVGPASSGKAAATMFVPTKGEASLVDSDGVEFSYVRIKLLELSAE